MYVSLEPYQESSHWATARQRSILVPWSRLRVLLTVPRIHSLVVIMLTASTGHVLGNQPQRHKHIRIRMLRQNSQDLVAGLLNSKLYPRGPRAKGCQLCRLLPPLRQAVYPDVRSSTTRETKRHSEGAELTFFTERATTGLSRFGTTPQSP